MRCATASDSFCRMRHSLMALIEALMRCRLASLSCSMNWQVPAFEFGGGGDAATHRFPRPTISADSGRVTTRYPDRNGVEFVSVCVVQLLEVWMCFQS